MAQAKKTRAAAKTDEALAEERDSEQQDQQPEEQPDQAPEEQQPDQQPEQAPETTPETPDGSDLQTSQPDEPIPTQLPDRDTSQDSEPLEDESANDPDQDPSQQAVITHLKHETELEAERREHNSRTKGGDIREGELHRARVEHFERTDPDAAEAYKKQLSSV